ncbi:hypothetical protein TSAR_011954, partial [Trichomalopsis sarcophagae]
MASYAGYGTEPVKRNSLQLSAGNIVFQKTLAADTNLFGFLRPPRTRKTLVYEDTIQKCVLLGSKYQKRASICGL